MCSQLRVCRKYLVPGTCHQVPGICWHSSIAWRACYRDTSGTSTGVRHMHTKKKAAYFSNWRRSCCLIQGWDKRVARGETSTSECRVPPPYSSTPLHFTSLPEHLLSSRHQYTNNYKIGGSGALLTRRRIHLRHPRLYHGHPFILRLRRLSLPLWEKRGKRIIFTLFFLLLL